jgi:glutamate synthase (ferredoxin)
MTRQNQTQSGSPRLDLPPKQGLYDPQFEKDACGVGFVAHIKGKKSHDLVQQGLQILRNLDHRGACGCEVNTGDGAGILIQTPHEFLVEAAAEAGMKLPAEGQYGTAMIYLPQDPQERRNLEKLFEKLVISEGLDFLGWRSVPTDNSSLGDTAKASEPVVRQAFIGKGEGMDDVLTFERRLYVARKRSFNEIRCSTLPGAQYWYVCSMSSRTLVYKGMLLTEQVGKYFPDLNNPKMKTALALVHSRFSTNTFPSWARSHPYRYIAHNGEINTLRGNINWMHARESLFETDLFGDDVKKILPIVDPNGSDSAVFDNVLELLVLGGRSLPHAMAMMIPEPWANHESMSDERKAFYEYHSCLMEPWDGPACIRQE